MAKYEIHHICGHTSTVQIYGKYTYRYAEIERQEKMLCPDCYAEAQAKAISDQAAEYELPALTGSPKQIAWAEKIRMQFINTILDKKLKLAGSPALEIIKSVTRAAYWIDHRNQYYMDWLKDTKALMENESK